MKNYSTLTSIICLALGTAATVNAQQQQPTGTPMPMQAAPAPQAAEMGRVISSTPIIQQVAVPTKVCGTQQVAVQQPKSGAGGIMGAIAGGAIGNAVGGGTGRGLATVAGFIGGAVVGDHIEGAPASQVQNVQTCSTQTSYENRTAGYHVVYEYMGRQFSTQLPQDPGQYVQLQVTPVGLAAQTEAQIQAPNAVAPQVIYVPPAVVGVAAPYPYFYPSVAIGIGVGVGYGGRSRRHF